VVGADLQSLVSAHNQSSLAVLLVLEKSNITSSALLPLVCLTDKLEKLGAHLECLLLELFVGLDLNFLCETNDRLEMNILGLRGFVLYVYHQRCSQAYWSVALIVAYLWVFFSILCLLSLCRTRVFTTILVLYLLLLWSTAEH
jgi:hypothetical protein